MEQIDYLSGENTVHIDNQQKETEQVKETKSLFMSEEVSLNQLAEIIYNSYLRKHPTLREGQLLNEREENSTELKQAV